MTAGPDRDAWIGSGQLWSDTTPRTASSLDDFVTTIDDAIAAFSA